MRVFINMGRRPDLSSRARSPGLSVRETRDTCYKRAESVAERKRRLSSMTLDALPRLRKREIVRYYRLALNLDLSRGGEPHE